MELQSQVTAGGISRTPRWSRRSNGYVDPDAGEKSLLRQLCRLYAAERLLDAELRRLFERCQSLPLRFVLADQRRTTNRQILRLERIIQIKTGSAASNSVGRVRSLKRRRNSGASAAPAADTASPSLAFPLLAAEAGVAAYGSAIALSRRLGEVWCESLLIESWDEKRQMATVLQNWPGTGDDLGPLG